ncbi:unnamed protein product [Lupinus luteus]|uniref:Uncharacterized protein n=1 Tax=Lupinus luteus TaxID=3873 RepID=A0AAV1WU08_LUPLU
MGGLKDWLHGENDLSPERNGGEYTSATVVMEGGLKVVSAEEDGGSSEKKNGEVGDDIIAINGVIPPRDVSLEMECVECEVFNVGSGECKVFEDFTVALKNGDGMNLAALDIVGTKFNEGNDLLLSIEGGPPIISKSNDSLSFVDGNELDPVNCSLGLCDVQPSHTVSFNSESPLSVDAGFKSSKTITGCAEPSLTNRNRKQKMSKKAKQKQAIVEWKNLCIDLGDVPLIHNPESIPAQGVLQEDEFAPNAFVHDPIRMVPAPSVQV